jgi:hypothetical protein
LLRSAEVKPFVLKICSTIMLDFLSLLLEGWSLELGELAPHFKKNNDELLFSSPSYTTMPSSRLKLPVSIFRLIGFLRLLVFEVCANEVPFSVI